MKIKKNLIENNGQIEFLLWAFYFLLLWQILLLAQNPGLMADDSGEMAAAAYGLGLPHPPGYPLFNLIGHLVCWLPLGTVAFRLNLFSEALALISLLLIIDTARKLDFFGRKSQNENLTREILLVAVGLVFISCRSIFAQCFTAKGCIYMLTLLFTSAVVWLYVIHQRHPEDRRPLLGAVFLWALGMANHWQTHILWLPFLAFWALQSKSFLKSKMIIISGALILTGLSLYLYLPLRAKLDCKPCWGYPINLSLFYWVVSRKLVSGVEHWIQSGNFYISSAKEMGAVLFLHWLPGFTVLGLAGLFILWRQKKNLFYGFFILFAPVFIAVFFIHEEINTYLLPAYLVSLSGLIILFGFVALRRLQLTLPGVRGAVLGATLLGVVALVWLENTFKLENKNWYTMSEDFGTNVMKCLPRGAILLADGDHYVMPLWYDHYARGLRPDLLIEPSVFLFHGWGWRQLGNQSRELAPLLASSNLLFDRLNSLRYAHSSHPLFYPLGRNYLKPALDKMPGFWAPRGLVYAWEPKKLSRDKVVQQAFGIISEERMRGLPLDWTTFEIDLSSQQIYRYYADQMSILKQ